MINHYNKGTPNILLTTSMYSDVRNDTPYRFRRDQTVWAIGKMSSDPVEVFIFPANVIDISEIDVSLFYAGKRWLFQVDSSYIQGNKIEALKEAANKVKELRSEGYYVKFVGTREP